MSEPSPIEPPAVTATPPISATWHFSGNRILLIQFLAAVALAIAGYLVYQSVTGAAVAGCGAASDCQTVLSSKWSSVFGVPVSVFGAILYLAILIATFFNTRPALLQTRNAAWHVLAGLSTIALLAAVWFVIIQVFLLHRFCFYCNTEHVVGLAIGILVLTAHDNDNRRVLGGVLNPMPYVIALFLVGVLAAAQIQFSHAPSRVRISTRTPLGHDLRFDADITDWPLLGSPTAPHLVIEMADYTCPHCRALMPEIERIRNAYPGQIGLVILPIPLSADCNPAVNRTDPMHVADCDLARLALAVYRADPAKFELMHHWLLDREDSPTLPDARKHAESLVGQDALTRALNDPWVEDALKKSVTYYVETRTTSVPTLIFIAHSYSLQNPEQAQVFDIFEREFHLNAYSDPPGR